MVERHGSGVTVVRCLRTLLAAACLLPAGLSGQAIIGRSLDEATGSPLALVEVRLLDRDGRLQQRTTSDSAGVFRIRAPLPGSFLLEGMLIGYETVRSTAFDVAVNSELTIELRMGRNAIVLDPIRVVAQRNYGSNRLSDYYRRAEWARASGIGKVYTRADIDRLRIPFVRNYAPGVRAAPGTTSEYYSQPRIHCIATTYLDGMRATLRDIDASLTADDVEGVEVYIGAEVPIEFMGMMEAPCAVVLYWTRPEARHAMRLTLGRVAVGVVLLTAVLLTAR